MLPKESKLFANIVRGLPTFPGRNPEYHRPWEISLPCSEWERVEHSQYGPLTISTNLY